MGASKEDIRRDRVALPWQKQNETCAAWWRGHIPGGAGEGELGGKWCDHRANRCQMGLRPKSGTPQMQVQDAGLHSEGCGGHK